MTIEKKYYIAFGRSLEIVKAQFEGINTANEELREALKIGGFSPDTEVSHNGYAINGFVLKPNEDAPDFMRISGGKRRKDGTALIVGRRSTEKGRKISDIVKGLALDRFRPAVNYKAVTGVDDASTLKYRPEIEGFTRGFVHVEHLRKTGVWLLTMYADDPNHPYDANPIPRSEYWFCKEQEDEATT